MNPVCNFGHFCALKTLSFAYIVEKGRHQQVLISGWGKKLYFKMADGTPDNTSCTPFLISSRCVIFNVLKIGVHLVSCFMCFISTGFSGQVCLCVWSAYWEIWLKVLT